MRLRARLLHVLVLAPVTAVSAGALGATTPARAETLAAPQPVVVAIDPGHGGLPDAANPAQPFDPGAIAASGLMEKDVALDIGRRLAALLRADQVSPLLTRTADRWVDIPTREQKAIDAHAALFVSIHCNSFSDPSVGGSLVLYPSAPSLPFAQTVSDMLGRALVPAGIGDDGVQLRDNWWIHNPMPTATAEIGYLSNPHEAALMATAGFREQVAGALRDGIERFDPDIAARAAQILAWQRAHPDARRGAAPTSPASRSVAVPLTPAGSGLHTVLVWLVGVAAALALVRWREPVARFGVIAGSVSVRLLQGTLFRHRSARRRRQRARTEMLLRGQRQWSRTHSVYDELSL
jgi:N-acetylmuramoyl-L-alanine amidase